MTIKTAFLLLLFLCCVEQYKAHSQFSIGGQLRTRSEFRHGQGTLPEASASPAFFTSQRTRLNVAYSTSRLSFYTSLQDVRTWGQDISTVNRISADVNDGLMLHEAWAVISLPDTQSRYKLDLKIGRQELVYNDARLLGNLDWLQQGRRHELALMRFSFKKISLHAGTAFNQNKEGKSGTIYNGAPAASGYPAGYTAGTNSIGTMYKAMQFVYLNLNARAGNFSFLFLKDDYNKFDYTANLFIYKKGVWSRMTGGTYLELPVFKKLKIITSMYYQGGRNKSGKEISACLLSAFSGYRVNSRLTLGPGADFTSGNNDGEQAGKDKAFDPLYGTPHKFWGYMDYFYAADPFGNRGLTDYYVKLKYSLRERLSLHLDIHRFHSSGKVKNTPSEGGGYKKSMLGTEIDFTSALLLNSDISFEGGYCIMFGTSTLERIKMPASDTERIGQWAYLMISVKSDFFKTKLKSL